MIDPLHHTMEKYSDVPELKFAKLHCPKMKSVYWRHFGFPSNENDHIITKQNVVCMLCHKVLTNHGNTTNLRAHLQHRHKDIFSRICQENGIRVPPRKNFKPCTQIVKREPLRRVKVEYAEVANESDTAAAQIAEEDQTMLYESMVPLTYDDDEEVIDADHFTKVDVPTLAENTRGGINNALLKRDMTIDSENEMMCGIEDRKESSVGNSYRISTVIEDIQPYQLQEALVNIIVQDMRNVETLYDEGMSAFVRLAAGQNGVPSPKKVEALIKEQHSDKFTTLLAHIKIHSQEKPFSLGFDVWSNVELKRFVSIYYNYTTDAPDYSLMNQLYITVEYNEFTSIDSVFAEFKMQNCTAAIVNYDGDDLLKSYLTDRSIPIILSYDLIVDKCLRNVFEMPDVIGAFDAVKEVILRYTNEINSKEVELPIRNDEFPWTFYDLLKFFTETVSWPEDVDTLVNTAKAITEVLGILVITLDTLKGEEIPHSSMLSPITSKILTTKLSVTDDDDDFVATIKTTISAELKKLVLADDHLTIAALLDPRFHRLTKINNPTSCTQILTDKFKKIVGKESTSSTSTVSIKNLKESAAKIKNNSAARKSNLELFFDIQDLDNPSATVVENNVESDLKRYRTEVYVSLDESPFCWWNKMGHIYGSLRQLAYCYQCVPCVVNLNFKKPIKQQIYEHQKRFMLSGNLIDAILFLNHHVKAN